MKVENNVHSILINSPVGLPLLVIVNEHSDLELLMNS